MRVILVGEGKPLYFLARQFVAKGHQITIIDRDAGECESLARRLEKCVTVLGDGSDPGVLEDSGARQADVLVALTSEDQDNLIACQIAQQMFAVPRVIALVNDPDNEQVFKQLGVTEAISATRIVATLLEEQAELEEVINLLPIAEGRIQVAEVVIGEGAPARDKTLRELSLPEDTLIAGIIRDGDVHVPRGSTRLHAGDTVILMARPASFGDALRAVAGEEV